MLRTDLWLVAVAASLVLADVGLAQTPNVPPKKKPAAKADVLPADAESEKELLELAGDGFKIRSTPHYVIAYDTDEPTLKAFVNRVETTYKAVNKFADKMGVKVKRPDEKLQILFFNKFASFKKYAARYHFPASQDAPGFYSQTTNRSAFFNAANADTIKNLREQLAQARESGKHAAAAGQKVDFNRFRAIETRLGRYQERINCLVVQHEVAHQVFFNIGLHVKGAANPRWFVEGLAMMFETPPGSGGAGIGAINQERLGNWKEFGEKKTLPDIKTLVTDPSPILPNNPNAVTAYAQSWAMVHYLQRMKRKELVTYIDLIRQRKQNRVYSTKEELKTFEKAFGPLDEEFTQKWEIFIKKIPYKPSEAS